MATKKTRKCKCTEATQAQSSMHTLEYYFGNSPPPVRPITTPPIVLNIGCRRKRPVGCPRKAQKSTSGSSSLSPAKRPRLVDYSDTENEAEVTQSHPTVDGAMSTSINKAGSSQEPKKIRKCTQKDKRRKWQSMHTSME